MKLVDTSAWIEFTRGGTPLIRSAVRAAIDSDEAVTSEPIAMEVLAGARDEAHMRTLSNMLAVLPMFRVEGFADWRSAAVLYRRCREAGVTPRSQLDCLIAAVAIREDIPVLHADRDFDLIAQHTPLRVVAV